MCDSHDGIVSCECVMRLQVSFRQVTVLWVASVLCATVVGNLCASRTQVALLAVHLQGTCLLSQHKSEQVVAAEAVSLVAAEAVSCRSTRVVAQRVAAKECLLWQHKSASTRTCSALLCNSQIVIDGNAADADGNADAHAALLMLMLMLMLMQTLSGDGCD